MWRVITHITPQRYPYFDVVVVLTWSNDPESYARSKVMTQTRDTLVLQVSG
jgi:hypothetical protein